jgi:hypothetical protein
MSILHLTVSPESFQFEAHEERDLSAMLVEMDRATKVIPVVGPSDLFLQAEEGRTTSGYGYSDTALLQLCGLVAPGLAQLLGDLSGQWHKAGDDRRFFSGSLAVEILNRCLRLRFDRKLVGLQLVCNTKTKVIDGIVGAKYRYLANHDFLDRTTTSLQRMGSKFHGAFLYGRQLVSRYSQEKTSYTISGETYHAGFHFANSEIGGRSVRAAVLLVRALTGDCALGPFAGKDGGRVVHSGRDFEKRLHALLEGMVRKLPLPMELEKGERALERKLGLGTELHAQKSRQLATTLTRKKLTLNFAKRVVSSAAARGRDETDSLVDALPGEGGLVLTERTGYDLFTALIREARRLPIDLREVAEQCAFALLTGKFWI